MNLLFLPFKTDISHIELPEKFTYPFNYTPNKLSEISAKELQDYLTKQIEWKHNFGFDTTNKSLAIGKMFGVLVCKDMNGNLGQLWAFSGKLAEGNQWTNFVPTVFDMLIQEGFYKKGEAVLNEYNSKIKAIEEDSKYHVLLSEQEEIVRESQLELSQQKSRIKFLKSQRQLKRDKALKELSADSYSILANELNEESKKENIILKKMNKKWNVIIANKKDEVDTYLKEIDVLKQLRKDKSTALQQQLFKKYTFLNVKGVTKSLSEIFDNNPPAGAGECCAPKLLHYAFSNNLQPLCMAEFWWGKSPNSEIRKHQNFYPSCRSKCEPILLKHMLKGLNVEDNPLEQEINLNKSIEIVYDDEWLAVINKPCGLLSVPGKRIKNSVYTQVQQMYPEATGPLMVHRLDRATSGLMIIAKDLQTYIALQKQFTARLVKKRYIALLDGIIASKKGEINLPLRVDLDNRPQQLVCYKHGKPSKTSYNVVKVENNTTLIHFFPITGRTHQLRVHSAHIKGLNTPILGDDLYGKPNRRLFLHAEYVSFKHPVTDRDIQFELENTF